MRRTISGLVVTALTIGLGLMSSPAHASTPEEPPDSLAVAISAGLASATDNVPLEPGVESDNGVLVPEDITDPVEIKTADGEQIAISLPVPEDATVEVTDSGDIAVEADNVGAELLVQELDPQMLDGKAAGVRVIMTIPSRETDPLFEFGLDVPDDATLDHGEDSETVSVLSPAGDLLALVGAPWAVDADGREVATWYEIEDGKLYQYVDHLANEYTYPVVADPPFLVPLALVGGRIALQRVIAASAAQASRSAIAALARQGDPGSLPGLQQRQLPLQPHRSHQA